MRRIHFAIALLAALTALGGCQREKEEVLVAFKKASGERTPTVRAELVQDERRRQLGLMYRKELGDRQGMLFVFPEETIRRFWMKNTYIPLDMIFVNRQKKVVSLLENVPPLTEDQRVSEAPATFVLEVPAGRIAAWGLATGDSMIFRDGEKLISPTARIDPISALEGWFAAVTTRIQEADKPRRGKRFCSSVQSYQGSQRIICTDKQLS